MDNKKNGIPKLRFPGFTGAWEQRKLGEVVKKSTIKNSDLEYSKDDILSVATMSDMNFSREINSTKDYMKTYNKILYGEIAFEGHSSKNYKFGRFVLNDYRNGIVSHIYDIYKITINYDMKFMKEWISLDKVMYKPLVNSTTNARMMNSLQAKNLYKQKVLLPNLQEQKEIGKFLKKVDSLIALHQRKLEHLQEQKKGLLQKMFPKNGETVPEVRFPGFTDAWEQRKLGEGTLKIGDGLHGTPKYSTSGNVLFINGNNLINGKVVITSETKRVTSNQQSKDDKELNQNTILMSINGTIGSLAWYRNENLMLGKSVAYIEVSEFDKKFVYAYLQTTKVKFYFISSLTGTTIKNLGLKAIRETPLLIPNIEEQEKIGEFFQQLDSLIALHQRKLEHLELMKKGLLQQMFV